MKRIMVLLLACATWVGAQPLPAQSGAWSGTIVGRPATCVTMPFFGVAPGGGDAAVATSLGLWCTGGPRHFRSLRMVVSVTDREGNLALDGSICRRGPRPHRPNGRSHGCCFLGGGTFTGTFRPAYPPDTDFTGPVLPTVGQLMSISLGVSCRHLTYPIPSVILMVSP